jgi:hypothetical protein
MTKTPTAWTDPADSAPMLWQPTVKEPFAMQRITHDPQAWQTTGKEAEAWDYDITAYAPVPYPYNSDIYTYNSAVLAFDGVVQTGRIASDKMPLKWRAG